ncbi:MAG: hypothetical protein ABI330_21120 [Caldimonas sp.]
MLLRAQRSQHGREYVAIELIGLFVESGELDPIDDAVPIHHRPELNRFVCAHFGMIRQHTIRTLKLESSS